MVASRVWQYGEGTVFKQFLEKLCAAEKVFQLSKGFNQCLLDKKLVRFWTVVVVIVLNSFLENKSFTISADAVSLYFPSWTFTNSQLMNVNVRERWWTFATFISNVDLEDVNFRLSIYFKFMHRHPKNSHFFIKLIKQFINFLYFYQVTC